MKKRILLFSAIAGMTAAICSSGRNGAGAEKHFDCTGAETGTVGCSQGISCHGGSANSAIPLSLELDSAGIATTHYTGGMTYTVRISGENTTSNSLPKFGFQVSCIVGSTGAASPTNAGSFATTGLPTDVRYTAAISGHFVCNIIEHSDPITATTGTGASGSTYVESFAWTAPASGTGTVSFWGALNAVTGDTTTPAGDTWNTTSLIINEWPSTGVVNVTNQISVTAFPNPVINTLNLQMNNTQEGIYSLQVFDMNGRMVTTENITVNGTSHTSTINTGNWAPGNYHVVLEKDGNHQVIPVVKL